jgi:hypothetical protein
MFAAILPDPKEKSGGIIADQNGSQTYPIYHPNAPQFLPQNAFTAVSQLFTEQA